MQKNTEDLYPRQSKTLHIARIESFIVGKGLSDAKKSRTYSKAGADAILIHSKENPAEIFSFAKMFKKVKFYSISFSSFYIQKFMKKI